MKIEIELQDLLDVLIQVDSCSLIRAPDIAHEIERKDPDKSVAVIQWVNDNHPIVWPIKYWIDEQKRIKEMDETSAEFRRQYKPPPKQKPIDILELLQDPTLTAQQKQQMLKQMFSSKK